MLTDTNAVEPWLARLSAVRSDPLLRMHGAVTTECASGHVDAAATAALAAITGDDPVGLHLVAVAATKVALASLTGGHHHAVLAPAPRNSGGGEIALCTPYDPQASVVELLTALHSELESTSGQAWSDRSVVADRLEITGSPAVGALSDIAVVCAGAHHGGLLAPTTVVVTVVADQDCLTVRLDRTLGRIPVAAWSLASCVATVLTAIAADPRRRCAEIEILDAGQRDVLRGWSGLPCPTEFPARSLLDVVDTAARQMPGRPAIVSDASSWNHGELHTRSCHAAWLLRNHYRVGTGDRVALLLPRGPELLLALLAVLRAGASVVPLDPAHPAERLSRLLQLSGARHVVTTDTTVLPACGLTVLPVATLLAAAEVDQTGQPATVGADDDAVVFFTSGSTGAPRPVMLRHRQLAYKAVSSGQLIGFDAQTRCALLSALSSDATVYQIFTTLAAGGCLVALGAPEDLDPATFWGRLRSFGVTAVNCVPALLAAMLDGLTGPDRFPLRHCLLGGDTIPRGLLPRMAARLAVDTFVNLYGPCETTIEAANFRCTGEQLAELDEVPIGNPSPGFGVVVVDDRGSLAAVGIPGEVYIAGAGVADGYLDDPDATQARFAPLPLLPETSTFRTGDFARWRPDGQLEFLGRRDSQVKVHGNRVELGEIEHALVGLPGVRAATVLPRRESSATVTLIAGYVADPSLSPDTVRGALAELLPPHMLPHRLVPLTALPVTAHGKVDGAAVLARADELDEARWEPNDDLGRSVVAAWTDVLGQPPRAADEDFFAAGGHSLTAALLANRLCEQVDRDAVTVRQVFLARTPTALTAALAGAKVRGRTDTPASTGAPRQPASNAQRRMWFLENYDDSALRPYNMVEAYRLTQPVDKDALSRALELVVARHESLRTALVSDGDLLDAVVLPAEQVAVELRVHADDTTPVAEQLSAAIEAEQTRRFDLSSGRMLRASWLPDPSGRGTLVLAVHHSVCDGWSMAVILRDLLAYLDDGGRDLPAEPVQYAQHSAALAARLAGSAGADSRAYWGRVLADLPETDLPLDRRRPQVRSSSGGAVRLSLGHDTTRQLVALCRELGATPFTGLIAATRVLLHRLCGTVDIPVGTVVSGRDGAGLADSVGLFVNTVVHRTLLRPESGFRDLVTAVRQSAQDVRAHDEYPFEALLDDLQVDRAANRNPLFDVLVESIISGLDPLSGIGDARVDQLDVEPLVSDFDIAFGFTEASAHTPVEMWIGYRDDVFDRATVRRLAAQLRHLLAGLLATPDAPVRSVPLLPDEQRHYLLEEANDSAAPFPADSNLLDLVDEQVRLRPGSAAVICADRTLTFAELSERADELAAQLAARAPVGPDRLVAVACARTEWMVVALLAVLRTGAAFLPLDPEQPASRLAALLSASGAVAVLADDPYAAKIDDAGVPVLGPGAAPVARPTIFPTAAVDGLAYVIYTSGSTGTPKGVMVEHRGIVNTVHYRAGYYGFDADSCVLQVPPIHFDSGINDVFSALVAGTPVVVVSREQLLDADAVAAEIERHRVTHVMMVPSLYQVLLARCAPALRSVRQIVLVGERLTGALAARHAQLLPDTVLYNEYGPTEDSVWTTVHRITGYTGDVLIGHPIANKVVDLLDPAGELVPLGVAGELCIGGVGLARGYLGDPELTARRFTANPVRPGHRMYRTGDLARRLPSGLLQYLGRIDDQVKIRGQRVEPGEVAAVLSEAPGVAQCAVIATPAPGGELRLVAYLVGEVDPDQLRGYAARRLPAAMVPEAYVSMPELPVTVNGKLDRRALPAPTTIASSVQDDPVLTDAQRRVVEVWSRILDRPVTDLDANLFHLGGHSIAAARIGQQLGVSVRTVFTHQTVRELAQVLPGAAGPGRSCVASSTATAAPSEWPLSHAQRRIWLGSRGSAETFLISDLVHMHRGIDPAALRSALGSVVARQEMLRAQLSGAGSPPNLVVLPELPDGPPLVVVDLPENCAPTGPEVAAALRDARARSFALTAAPLFELRLLRGPAGGDLLTVTAHHLIYDGASVEVLLGDLFACYDADSSAAQQPPALGCTYRDWAAQERDWLESDDSRGQEKFWRDRLADPPAGPEVGRRGARRGSSGLARRWLDAAVVAEPPSGGVRQPAVGRTGFTTALTAFAALLHRRTGSTDMVLGFPVSLRDRPELDRLVGNLVNAVPLRLTLDPAMRLGQLADHVQDRMLEAYENSKLPFDVLVERLGLRAGAGRSVLLDLGVSWEDADLGPAAFEIEDVLPERLTATSDLWLFARQRAGKLLLALTYDDNVLTGPEAADLADQLVELVRQVTERPQEALGDGTAGRPPADSWGATSFDL